MPSSSMILKRGWPNVFSTPAYLHQDSPFSYDGWSALAFQLAQRLQLEFAPSKKLIIVDGDNTLWGGVLGEDGLNGVQFRPETPEGRAFAFFQRQLRRMREAGFLLALVSKNEPADVDRLLQLPDFLLKRDDFAAVRCSWSPKVDVIQNLSRELGLALGSMVFLDDNAAEIMAVRQDLPEIDCRLLPADPARLLEVIPSIPGLQREKITEEDALRTSSYVGDLSRQELQKTTGNQDEYLRRLGIYVKLRAVETNFERVAQLLQRTTQFNCSGQHFSAALLESAGGRLTVYAVRYTDCFAPEQIVGVIIAEMRSAPTIHIRNFVLSCRILGREVEKTALRKLLQIYSSDCKFIFHFAPTERNAPARIFLESILGHPPEDENAISHDTLTSWTQPESQA